MEPKSYSKHRNLLQECNNTHLQLPSPANKKCNTVNEKKEGYFKRKNSKYNLWKLLGQHAAQFITLILAAQVAAVQATGDNTTDSIPRESSANELNKLNVLQTNASTNTRISQELKQNILHQFDKINDDLQGIIKMFIENKPDASLSPQSSLVLLPAFGQTQECTVTKDALNELQNMINGTLLGINTNETEINCESNSINTNSCDEILKLMQCGVNHLKIGLIDAIQNIVALEHYLKLNNDLYEKFQNISDQINQQTSEKYKQQLHESNKNMQGLHKYLNTTISQLREETKGLCISEIGNGHIEIAVKKFKELNAFDDDDLTQNIIEKAYTDYGNLSNFDNIINFIAELLPWSSQMVTSYEALFDTMEKNTSKILIFVTKVQNAKELDHIANETLLIARLDNLNSKALIHVNNFSNAWVDKIRNNEYEEILKFSQTYTDAINFNLDRLIERTYDNDLKNAEKIIEFIRNLSSINSSIISLHSLFNQMKNHGNDLDSSELLMLAYHCRDLMISESYHSLTPYYKDQLMAIKGNLSDSIRRLIWDGSDCTMRNRIYNEYLFAGNAGHARDKERRNVYTLRTGKANYECHWKITPQKYGEFFSIQNTYYDDEYLYAAADDLAYDSNRRNVFTWRRRGEAAEWTFWKLVPVSNGEYFIIRHKDYNYEYLYPGYDKLVRDEKARYVFTWRKFKETPTKEGHWDIYC